MEVAKGGMTQDLTLMEQSLEGTVVIRSPLGS